MSNYDSLRSSVGTTNSKYFLKDLDYMTKRGSGADYGRSSDYTHGSKQYDSSQYSSGYDSYAYDKAKFDYKSKYDNYTSDSSSYLKASKKLDVRDLRNTTNVLPSYFAEQRDKDYISRSPRGQADKEYFENRDRKGTRTLYEAPSSLKTGKDVSPKRMEGHEKAKYLSPGKYDTSSSSSSALSPGRYNTSTTTTNKEYSNSQKLAALMDKLTKLQSPSSSSSQPTSTSPPPLTPTSPRE